MLDTKATADLCDEYGSGVQVVSPALADFGAIPSFSGPVTTLQVHEDNALVRAALEEPGDGRVLVVDGAGSLRTALVGGNLGKLAETQRWSGIVVWGAVRDVAELRRCNIGLRALGATPRKSAKTGAGRRDVPVEFGGVTIRPGQWLAADADGIVVFAESLKSQV
jgi:regulator of ribonuclease activity A